MTTVDKKYYELLSKLSGKERLKKACALHQDMYNILKHKIITENPGMDPRSLKKAIAARFYMTNEAVLKLIASQN